MEPLQTETIKKRPSYRPLSFHGADNGIRTRDPHLGKVMLYQLSHVRMLGYQKFGGDARIRTGGEGFAGLCLTTWPRRHPGVLSYKELVGFPTSSSKTMERTTGFEPATLTLAR